MYLEVAPYLEAPYLDMGCHPNCEGAEVLCFNYLIPTQKNLFLFHPHAVLGRLWQTVPNREEEVAQSFHYLIPTLQGFLSSPRSCGEVAANGTGIPPKS